MRGDCLGWASCNSKRRRCSRPQRAAACTYKGTVDQTLQALQGTHSCCTRMHMQPRLLLQQLFARVSPSGATRLVRRGCDAAVIPAGQVPYCRFSSLPFETDTQQTPTGPNTPAPAPAAAAAAVPGARRKRRLHGDIPPLQWFMQQPPSAQQPHEPQPPTPHPSPAGATKRVFVETYGCQMNVADSEVVSSLLQQHGYTFAPAAAAADVVLINTCAIRDNAEARIWGRLAQLRDTRRVRLREGR